MNYAISVEPVAPILSAYQLTVTDLGDGASTLVNVADGQVLSCQPNGVLEWRPSGANGPYERCVVKEGTATYNPVGTGGPGYVFALKAVANA